MEARGGGVCKPKHTYTSLTSCLSCLCSPCPLACNPQPTLALPWGHPGRNLSLPALPNRWKCDLQRMRRRRRLGSRERRSAVPVRTQKRCVFCGRYLSSHLRCKPDSDSSVLVGEKEFLLDQVFGPLARLELCRCGTLLHLFGHNVSFKNRVALQCSRDHCVYCCFHPLCLLAMGIGNWENIAQQNLTQQPGLAKRHASCEHIAFEAL